MLTRLEQYVQNSSQYYAHISETKKPEQLQEHLERTMFYYNKICKKKDMEHHVKQIIHEIVALTPEEELMIYDLFVNAIYLHDLGKINPNFQKRKMKNDLGCETKQSNSEHSSLSALLYIAIFEPEIKWCRHFKEMKLVLYIFAYIISRHHTYLENLNGEDFLEKLKEMQDSNLYEAYLYKEEVRKLDFEENLFLKHAQILKEKNFAEIEFYLLAKSLYSLLVSCDYYATYEYQNGHEVEITTIEDSSQYIQKYHQTEVYQAIESYKKDAAVLNEMNRLRTEIFLEAEENLKKNKENNIFYLEAPTGSGKTNTSIHLALTLLEQNASLKNIFYIFPFNTLVEQTKQSFEKIFQYEKEVMVVNSQTAITKREDDIDYEKIFLDYQFMHYPIVLTSHVHLFSALFGSSRESNLWLSRLADSIIILDEIQSYKNSLWQKMITFFKKYAKFFNIKIIIMSATLPKLDELLEKKENIAELLTDKEKYYQNKQFSQRVEIDTSLLQKGKIDLEELCEFVGKLPEQKILIEFFRKKSAREMWLLLKARWKNREILLLTGDDNRYTRKQSLNKIKESNSMIVVCTQVIEAGVDIDMDLGLKDVSLIDSEEQFLGRINRSCKKQGCKAYFFHYDDCSKIYRNDERNQFSIRDLKYEQILKEKDFERFYFAVLKRLKEKGEENNRNNITEFWNQVRNLEFKNVEREMKLIEERNQSLFLSRNIIVQGQEIKGRDVWEQYKELCINDQISYAQKQILLSKIREKMDWFLYQIAIYENQKQTLYGDEEFGDILYIENGEKYLEEGNFLPERYFEEGSQMML